MAKMRFTDIEKWKDPWFMGLPSRFKLLWLFLVDNCDNAGVWAVNEMLATVQVGEVIDWKEAVDVMSARIRPIDGGRKWYLVKFIRFQQPRGLNPTNPAHEQVLRLLASHSLEEEGEGLLKGLSEGPSERPLCKSKSPPSSSWRGSAEGEPFAPLQAVLGEFGITCNAKGADEWAGGLKANGIRKASELAAFLTWALKVCKREDVVPRYWRHVATLGAEWNRRRDELYPKGAA